MTTYFPFVPSNQTPPSFQPTLDGQVYNAVVTWNLFGADYYINLLTLNGDLVFCRAMSGSPTGVAIEAISWVHQTVDVTTIEPHGYKIGNTVKLTLSGNAPDSLNGLFSCLVIGPYDFTFPLATDPGPATQLGLAEYNINFLAGYLNAAGQPFSSTMVFRQQAQQFEITP